MLVLLLLILSTYSGGADRGIYQEYDYNNNLSKNWLKYDSDYDSSNVEFVGNWPFGPSYAVSYDSIRDLAFCGSGGGVYILDMTDPSNPVKISDIRTRGFVNDIFYDSNNQRLYIAEIEGLEIWDIANSSNPIKIGDCNTPNVALGVYVSGNYAYVAASGLEVVDVSDPNNPVEVGFCYAGWAYGVYVSGNYAYIAAYYSGLRIVDVSDPTDPIEIGFCNTPGNAEGVYVSGNYAYIADGDSGLRVIDISDPTNPYEVGYYDTPGIAKKVFVSDNYVYVADGECGLQIYRYLGVGVEEEPEINIVTEDICINSTIFSLSSENSILIWSNLPSSGKIEVYSVIGRKYFEKEFSNSERSISWDINSSIIARGMYFYIVRDNNMNTIKRGKFGVIE